MSKYSIFALERRTDIIEIKRFNSKLNIFVGFNKKFIIGHYFSKGMMVPRYNQRREVQIESFVIPDLKSRRKLKRTTFQQDEAPPHVCNFIKDLLTSNFNFENF